MHKTILTALALVFTLPSSAMAQCKPGEVFAPFLARFSQDKSFAVTRTLYPMTNLRHEFGHEDGKSVDVVIKTVVTKADDASAPTMKQVQDKYTLDAKTDALSSRAAKVKLFQPDSDFVIDYHFVKRHGCWYLHHIDDSSL
jgi:hypothetical protein